MLVPPPHSTEMGQVFVSNLIDRLLKSRQGYSQTLTSEPPPTTLYTEKDSCSAKHRQQTAWKLSKTLYTCTCQFSRLGTSVALPFTLFIRLGVPEQALGGIPQDLGLLQKINILMYVHNSGKASHNFLFTYLYCSRTRNKLSVKCHYSNWISGQQSALDQRCCGTQFDQLLYNSSPFTLSIASLGKCCSIIARL